MARPLREAFDHARGGGRTRGGRLAHRDRRGSVHSDGALRSGDLDAPSFEGRRLDVEWLGLDDRWLRAARRTKRPLASRLLRMPWIEREHWAILKRMMPRIDQVIGEASFTLLESGAKAECEAFVDVMPARLALNARRAARAR